MTARDQDGVRPSGRQYEIGFAEQRAVVVEVGGGVRVYEVGGRPVLVPYPVDAMADGADGTPLVPWPNRLRDGRYRFNGTEYQLPLTEPDKHNAIHGLLRWCAWRLVTVSSAGSRWASGYIPHRANPSPSTSGPTSPPSTR